jgi:hypothetical protein
MILTSVQDLVDGTGISRYLITKALNMSGVEIGNGKGKTKLEAHQVKKVETLLKVDLHKTIAKAQKPVAKPQAKVAKPKAKAAKPKAAKKASAPKKAAPAKVTKPAAKVAKPTAKVAKPTTKVAGATAKRPLKPTLHSEAKPQDAASTVLKDTDGIH